MEKTNTSSENIAEALKLLEEAAEQKKDELKNLMSNKYTHLRDAFMEAEGGLARSLADAKKHATDVATHAKDVSVEKAKEIAGDVDKKVQQGPEFMD